MLKHTAAQRGGAVTTQKVRICNRGRKLLQRRQKKRTEHDKHSFPSEVQRALRSGVEREDLLVGTPRFYDSLHKQLLLAAHFQFLGFKPRLQCLHVEAIEFLQQGESKENKGGFRT